MINDVLLQPRKQGMIATLYDNIARRWLQFLLVFFIVFTLSYAVLYALDFYPEPHDEIDVETEVETELAIADVTKTIDGDEMIAVDDVKVETSDDADSVPVDVEASLNPNRITIEKADVDVVVLNPASLDMTQLDNALLGGVVRHPQSAHFNDPGNILIFGHSSYLPTVFNKNFQAFNGIQNLAWGDEIVLYDVYGTTYTYRVDRVYKVKASETIIDNSRGKAMLTLVTCNSFGSEDDRFVVEATLSATQHAANN